MQKHNDSSKMQIDLLIRLLRVSRECKVVEPGGLLSGNPVSLNRLAFPTVEECAILGISDLEIRRLVGQQRFDEVRFRLVDFSQAKLDFAVWDKCTFRQVTFDRASLGDCRFFGCEFSDCSFCGTFCNNCSFAVSAGGANCKFDTCRFEGARLSSTAWVNPEFNGTSFVRCHLGKTEFDGAIFRNTRFEGNY